MYGAANGERQQHAAQRVSARARAAQARPACQNCCHATPGATSFCQFCVHGSTHRTLPYDAKWMVNAG
jgi:hypothetical protein